jgi:hypothetical protein
MLRALAALPLVLALTPAGVHRAPVIEPYPSVASLTGDTNRPNNSTFVQGEPVVLTFHVQNDRLSMLRLEIVDEAGHRVASASVPLTNGTASYNATSARLGYYRVNARLADGTRPGVLGTRPAGFITYAVVPDPASRKDYGDSLSRFGMQGGFAASQGSVLPYLGIRYVLGVPDWSKLEPNHAGQFAEQVAHGHTLSRTDYLDGITYKGSPWNTYEIAQVSSASIPPWAGPLPGTAGSLCKSFGALNAAGIAGLPDFATALAKAFAQEYPHQSQHFYQITWEPETPWCFNGSGKQLTQFYRLVYGPLHAADRSAQVIGPTLFPADHSQLASMYAAGFARFIDAFSMHPYVRWPAETSPFIQQLRTEKRSVEAAAHRRIAFFGTEHGLVSGQIGELNQALGNVREEIILLGEGFIHDYVFYIADFWINQPSEPDHTFGFYWNLNPTTPFGTNKLGPKPAVPAYAALTYFLDGTVSHGAIKLSGSQLGYRFRRGNSVIIALWDYGPAVSHASLPVPRGSLQICDWMGNCQAATAGTGTLSLTLGAAPTYVIYRDRAIKRSH